jgi:acyl-CoA dehydrogenase
VAVTADTDTEFLAGLRSLGREHAAALRGTALRFDAEPGLAPRLVVQRLPWRQLMGMPAAYNQDPFRVHGRPAYLDSCLQQVVMFEELARADAAAVLALPGPSMSGFVVAELGDEPQRARYYQLLAEEPTWTFFGLTEPAHGSDPGGMDTALRPGPAGTVSLNGVKRFVGNGARARIGVVFARRHSGPLGIMAVLLDTTRPGFASVPLETLGLRALQLSELRMRDVPIAPEDLLGHGKSATRQGMWAAMRTFNRYRPVVSCLALGAAQGAYDYMLDNRRELRSAERHLLAAFEGRLHGVRALILAAAAAVDRSPDDGALASAAKIRATHLAEEITTTALQLLGPGARWEHPLLDKLARDARGFEFMEGTSSIQRLTLAQGYLQGRLADALPA